MYSVSHKEKWSNLMFSKYYKPFRKLFLIGLNTVFWCIELSPILLNKIAKKFLVRLEARKIVTRFYTVLCYTRHNLKVFGKDLCCKIKIIAFYRANVIAWIGCKTCLNFFTLLSHTSDFSYVWMCVYAWTHVITLTR